MKFSDNQIRDLKNMLLTITDTALDIIVLIKEKEKQEDFEILKNNLIVFKNKEKEEA